MNLPLFKKLVFCFLLGIFLFQAGFVLALEIKYPPVPGALTPNEIQEKIKSGELQSEKALGAYFNYFVKLFFLIAIFIAVSAGIFGGVLYLLSPAKPAVLMEAKQWIYSSLLGVLILVVSYLVLATINPQLLVFKTKIEPLPPPVTPSLSEEDKTLIAQQATIGSLATNVISSLYETVSLEGVGSIKRGEVPFYKINQTLQGVVTTTQELIGELAKCKCGTSLFHTKWDALRGKCVNAMTEIQAALCRGSVTGNNFTKKQAECRARCSDCGVGIGTSTEIASIKQNCVVLGDPALKTECNIDKIKKLRANLETLLATLQNQKLRLSSEQIALIDKALKLNTANYLLSQAQEAKFQADFDAEKRRLEQQGYKIIVEKPSQFPPPQKVRMSPAIDDPLNFYFFTEAKGNPELMNQAQANKKVLRNAQRASLFLVLTGFSLEEVEDMLKSCLSSAFGEADYSLNEEKIIELINQSLTNDLSDYLIDRLSQASEDFAKSLQQEVSNEVATSIVNYRHQECKEKCGVATVPDNRLTQEKKSCIQDCEDKTLPPHFLSDAITRFFFGDIESKLPSAIRDILKDELKDVILDKKTNDFLDEKSIDVLDKILRGSLKKTVAEQICFSSAKKTAECNEKCLESPSEVRENCQRECLKPKTCLSDILTERWVDYVPELITGPIQKTDEWLSKKFQDFRDKLDNFIASTTQKTTEVLSAYTTDKLENLKSKWGTEGIPENECLGMLEDGYYYDPGEGRCAATNDQLCPQENQTEKEQCIDDYISLDSEDQKRFCEEKGFDWIGGKCKKLTPEEITDPYDNLPSNLSREIKDEINDAKSLICKNAGYHWIEKGCSLSCEEICNKLTNYEWKDGKCIWTEPVTKEEKPFSCDYLIEFRCEDAGGEEESNKCVEAQWVQEDLKSLGNPHILKRKIMGAVIGFMKEFLVALAQSVTYTMQKYIQVWVEDEILAPYQQNIVQASEFQKNLNEYLKASVADILPKQMSTYLTHNLDYIISDLCRRAKRGEPISNIYGIEINLVSQEEAKNIFCNLEEALHKKTIDFLPSAIRDPLNEKVKNLLPASWRQLLNKNLATILFSQYIKPQNLKKLINGTTKELLCGEIPLPDKTDILPGVDADNSPARVCQSFISGASFTGLIPELTTGENWNKLTPEQKVAMGTYCGFITSVCHFPYNFLTQPLGRTINLTLKWACDNKAEKNWQKWTCAAYFNKSIAETIFSWGKQNPPEPQKEGNPDTGEVSQVETEKKEGAKRVYKWLATVFPSLRPQIVQSAKNRGVIEKDSELNEETEEVIQPQSPPDNLEDAALYITSWFSEDKTIRQILTEFPFGVRKFFDENYVYGENFLAETPLGILKNDICKKVEKEWQKARQNGEPSPGLDNYYKACQSLTKTPAQILDLDKALISYLYPQELRILFGLYKNELTSEERPDWLNKILDILYTWRPLDILRSSANWLQVQQNKEIPYQELCEKTEKIWDSSTNKCYVPTNLPSDYKGLCQEIFGSEAWKENRCEAESDGRILYLSYEDVCFGAGGVWDKENLTCSAPQKEEEEVVSYKTLCRETINGQPLGQFIDGKCYPREGWRTVLISKTDQTIDFFSSSLEQNIRKHYGNFYKLLSTPLVDTVWNYACEQSCTYLSYQDLCQNSNNTWVKTENSCYRTTEKTLSYRDLCEPEADANWYDRWTRRFIVRAPDGDYYYKIEWDAGSSKCLDKKGKEVDYSFLCLETGNFWTGSQCKEADVLETIPPQVLCQERGNIWKDSLCEATSSYKTTCVSNCRSILNQTLWEILKKTDWQKWMKKIAGILSKKPSDIVAETANKKPLKQPKSLIDIITEKYPWMNERYIDLVGRQIGLDKKVSQFIDLTSETNNTINKAVSSTVALIQKTSNTLLNQWPRSMLNTIGATLSRIFGREIASSTATQLAGICRKVDKESDCTSKEVFKPQTKECCSLGEGVVCNLRCRPIDPEKPETAQCLKSKGEVKQTIAGKDYCCRQILEDTLCATQCRAKPPEEECSASETQTTFNGDDFCCLTRILQKNEGGDPLDDKCCTTVTGCISEKFGQMLEGIADVISNPPLESLTK